MVVGPASRLMGHPFTEDSPREDQWWRISGRGIDEPGRMHCDDQHGAIITREVVDVDHCQALSNCRRARGEANFNPRQELQRAPYILTDYIS